MPTFHFIQQKGKNSMSKEELIESFSNLASMMIWENEGVLINSEHPWKLVSGNYSPIYINMRKMISSPEFLSLVSTVAKILFKERNVKFDVIAGGETAGIPYAFSLARDLNYPCVYVRKQKKGHGVANLVEGAVLPNSVMLLVEDLITDGGSKMNFIEAIRCSICHVQDVFVIFDREQGGTQFLEKENIQLHSLTTLGKTLENGVVGGYIDSEKERVVLDYLENPKKWHERNNLEYKI
jgi:orotate phosphoribosyltransferase